MKSPLFVIFTTVFVDLVGFGIVIPLIGLYGRHYGAVGWELALLGSIYSLMQFFFNPVWGGLSDRFGRRPILLITLAGSCASYFLFASANHFWVLIFSRAVAGVFAGNISTAQAYIADVTSIKDRAKGMGLLGAAFGIGFTLGPPIGGLAAAKIGLWAPGLIAGVICGLNVIVAYFRLPESLPENKRMKVGRPYQPLNILALKEAAQSPQLLLYLLIFSVATFAFTNMEQTFSLLFQTKFNLDTAQAGLQTGYVLMFAGILGALIQGGLIRKLAPLWGELRLMRYGLLLCTLTMFTLPLGPTYGTFFLLMIPMAFGNGFFNPSINALVSKSAQENNQGTILGLNQGLSALARALGPFCGLMLFEKNYHFPFWLASVLYAFLFLLVLWKGSTSRASDS